MCPPVTRGLVRARRATGKFHIATSDTSALCGKTAPTPAGWLVRGDRAAWEAARPELICKRCLATEEASR